MTVEQLEAILHEHRAGVLTCYDHPPTPERPVWCCVCGEHELLISWRKHVAAAIAAAPTPPPERDYEERLAAQRAVIADMARSLAEVEALLNEPGVRHLQPPNWRSRIDAALRLTTPPGMGA